MNPAKPGKNHGLHGLHGWKLLSASIRVIRGSSFLRRHSRSRNIASLVPAGVGALRQQRPTFGMAARQRGPAVWMALRQQRPTFGSVWLFMEFFMLSSGNSRAVRKQPRDR